MTNVSETEIIPGLVVHLDTDLLRKIGESETNAEVRHSVDRAVVGPHYFLVLAIDSSVALTVPLFSKSAPGSEQLDERLKSGLPDKWFGQPTFFSRWQHWKIPLSAVAIASVDEESAAGSRRGYAVADTGRLDAIAHWLKKNRAEWRAL